MEKIILEPLRIRRLSEIVETHLRDLILEGKLVANQKLPTEKQLCEQFGVSIVTAREAIKGLEVLGLIEKRKGRGGGIFVSEVHSEALKFPLYSFFHAKNMSSEHLTDVRMIVEPAAVMLATSTITSRELDLIRANIEFCDARLKELPLIDITENEFFGIEEKHIEFHRLIGEATQNPVLALTIEYVLEFLFKFKRKTLIPDPALIGLTNAEHWGIFKFIESGDAQGAGNAMKAHLERLQGYFVVMGKEPLRLEDQEKLLKNRGKD
jgi:DNA-binding FadR family transcriptional regulator